MKLLLFLLTYIDLNTFTSYFELFTGFNLAYSIEAFRVVLNLEVLDMSKSVEEAKSEKEIAEAKLRVHRNNPQLANYLAKKASEIYIEVQKFRDLHKYQKRFSNYPNGFKSAFLMSGIFCLFVLLLNGYSQFLGLTKDEHSREMLGFISFLLLTYNLIVFSRSFVRSCCKKNIQPFITLVMFLVSVFLCYGYISFVRKTPGSDSSNMLVSSSSVFMGLSAFFLHFIRAFLHKIITRYKATKYSLKVIKLTNDFGREVSKGFTLYRDKEKIGFWYAIKYYFNIK